MPDDEILKRFPVLKGYQLNRAVGREKAALCPDTVPWSLVGGHEEQAQRNHSQTLTRLAERGGLSPEELYGVVHDLPWHKKSGEVQITEEGAVDWLIQLVGSSKKFDL